MEAAECWTVESESLEPHGRSRAVEHSQHSPGSLNLIAWTAASGPPGPLRRLKKALGDIGHPGFRGSSTLAA